MALRNLTVATTLAVLTVGGAWFSPAAHAASTKTCVNSTTSNDPSNGWTTKTTQTQTSACGSNSTTGFSSTTTVTNPGGNQPPSKQ
ncbi:hypothetical protein V1291_004722 [Nitrobacteraceae bacterium AZCC 1564]